MIAVMKTDSNEYVLKTGRFSTKYWTNEVGITVSTPRNTATRQKKNFKSLFKSRASEKNNTAGMKLIPKIAYRFIVLIIHNLSKQGKRHVNVKK